MILKKLGTDLRSLCIKKQGNRNILFGITQEFDYIAASFVRDEKRLKKSVSF